MALLATWQVRAAIDAQLPLVLIHERDTDAGAVPFDSFFQSTPPDLIAAGVYGPLAVAWHPGPHRDVSCKMALMAMGATPLQAVSMRRTFAALGAQLCLRASAAGQRAVGALCGAARPPASLLDDAPGELQLQHVVALPPSGAGADGANTNGSAAGRL